MHAHSGQQKPNKWRMGGGVGGTFSCELSTNKKWRWRMWTAAACGRTHNPSQCSWPGGRWLSGAQCAFIEWTR